MDTTSAVNALSALAYESRLDIFRLLVRAGPEGMAAGEIAKAIGIIPNTLSNSLNILSGAGLVASRRAGRSIIYTAAYDRMGDLLAFLLEDCCAGDPAICGSIAEVASRSCAIQEQAC